MHDALRVDHHLDLCGCHTKQVTRLDHFKRLVHHSGRVHRNFAAHRPVRVGAGLLGGDVAQCGRVTGAKRAAGRGQDDLVHPALPGCGVFGQRLEDGGMFAVDGQQPGPALLHRAQEEFTTHHQRLFVGQQQALAAARRCQARAQTSCADDGGHHHIDLVAGRYIFHSTLRKQHLRWKPIFLDFFLQGAAMRLTRHGGKTGLELGTLLQHQVDLRGRTQGVDLEPVRVPCQHVKRVATDGAGRSQHGDALPAL